MAGNEWDDFIRPRHCDNRLGRVCRLVMIDYGEN